MLSYEGNITCISGGGLIKWAKNLILRSVVKGRRCDATDKTHADSPSRRTFIRVAGWDKWKKRVARRQRHYAIRIIKSRLTRRERGRRNRALMQVYALHYALRREKNVVTALNVRRLIPLTLLIYNKS